MANAVQADVVKTDSILTKMLGNWIGFMNSFVRQYPWFAYLGFWPANWYKMQRNINGKASGSLHQLESFADVQFSKIQKIESTLSEDGKKVQWYEWEAYSTSSKFTDDSATTAVIVEDVSTFAVGDIVRTIPDKGSIGTETTTTITAINAGTNTITLASAVDVVEGDKLMFITPKLTLGNKVQRDVTDPSTKLVITYFQKFGASATIDSEDLNKTRLLTQITDFAKNKFDQPKFQVLQNIISSWFFGRNTWGNSPENQGIITVIEEREARGQVSKFSMAGITDDKLKLKELQRILNLASTAPVYQGNEKPTVFCTTAFISVVSRLLQDGLVYNDNIGKTIEYGLESLSTPYFKNLNFITSPEMDHIYGLQTKAIVFPRELVWFRVPENEYVSEAWVPVKTQATKFSVIPQPIVTNDFREFTIEYKLANIFAGQSYDNTYMLIENLVE